MATESLLPWFGAQAFERLHPPRVGKPGGSQSLVAKFHRARMCSSEIPWFLKFGNKHYPVPRNTAVAMIVALQKGSLAKTVPLSIYIPILRWVNAGHKFRKVVLSPRIYRVLREIMMDKYDSTRDPRQGPAKWN